MSQEPTEMTNSRVLLQQNAIIRVREALGALNEQLAHGADLGLHAEVDVHIKRRSAGKTADGEMSDISIAAGAAETTIITIGFADGGPAASIMAMRAPKSL